MFHRAEDGERGHSRPRVTRKGHNRGGEAVRACLDFAEKVDRSFGWARLPTVAAIPVLIGLRDRLRAKNLYDTGRGELDKPPFEDPDVGRHLGARMMNGTYNDLEIP